MKYLGALVLGAVLLGALELGRSLGMNEGYVVGVRAAAVRDSTLRADFLTWSRRHRDSLVVAACSR